MLNTNTKVRPYLHQYPCDTNSIYLAIGFRGPDGEFVSPPYIGYAIVSRNIVSYKIVHSLDVPSTLVHFESYDEAYRIVYGKEREEGVCRSIPAD